MCKYDSRASFSAQYPFLTLSPSKTTVNNVVGKKEKTAIAIRRDTSSLGGGPYTMKKIAEKRGKKKGRVGGRTETMVAAVAANAHWNIHIA